MNIYILTGFINKSFSKPLERNVVYIPIIISPSVASKETTALCNLIGRRRCSAVTRKNAIKCVTASVLALS